MGKSQNPVGGVPGFCGFLVGGVFSAGAGGEMGGANADGVFNEFDIAAGVFGEVFPALRTADIAFPAVEDGVNRFGPVERRGGGELPDHSPIDLIAGADRDLVEIAERVDQGQGDVGRALHPHAVAGCDEVEPADPAGPAGRRAVFPAVAAAVAQFLRFVSEQFGDEAARADAG